jgi:hypothetical protein
MTDTRYNRLVDIIMANHFQMKNTELGRDIFENISEIDYDENEFNNYIRNSYAYLKRWVRTKRGVYDIYDECICIYLYYLASKRPNELQEAWQHNDKALNSIYADLGVSM